MKALTLWQPWATLVAVGAKTFETRSWSTRYRGELAIHAAKRKPKFGTLGFRNLVERVLKDLGFTSGFPLGVIVATCELTKVSPVESLYHDLQGMPLEDAFGDWSNGRFAWQLGNIKMLEVPIPARGSQGFWMWNER